MKKRILLISAMVMLFVCLFAIGVSAENSIIKLSSCPTLEEIHADRSAYVSTIDALEAESTYKTTDPDSVVVLSDLAETPTYYVYPAYYFIRSSTYNIAGNLSNFNNAIAAADATAFAGYTSSGGTWGNGECDYLIRIEMPKYVTIIQGQYKFEGSANLKEIYLPTKIVIDEETGLEKEVTYITSVSGQNLLSSCPSLEYVHNSGKLPVGIVQGNGDGFAGCSSLKEFEIPYGVTSIPLRCFNKCSSLTELVLPNTVTSVAKGTFSGCTKLEKIVMGESFTTFVRTNADYETFVNCNSLKYIYLPATFADSINATKNDFKSIFPQSAKTIYFITENDYDKIVEIQNKFITTNANGNIAGATIELYDPNKNYEEYQATLTKSVIVYGYNVCKAFYNDDHDEKPELRYDFSGEKYISDFCSYVGCTRCPVEVETKVIDSLFVSRGYSTSDDAFMYDIKVDYDAITEYKTFYKNNFDKEVVINYGLVISSDTSIDSLLDADGKAANDNILKVVFDENYSYTNIQIKFNNVLTEAQKALFIHACAYVIEDGAINYIGDGTTAQSSTAISYNKIVETKENQGEAIE